GSAEFSADVDLLTFFFLWRTCASAPAAPSRETLTPRTASLITGILQASRLRADCSEMRSKLHLFLGLATSRAKQDFVSSGRAAGDSWELFQYSLNQRTGKPRNCPSVQCCWPRPS